MYLLTCFDACVISHRYRNVIRVLVVDKSVWQLLKWTCFLYEQLMNSLCIDKLNDNMLCT